VRDGGELERPIITSGDDLLRLGRFLRGRTRYNAREVVEYLLESQVAAADVAAAGDADAATAFRGAAVA
jgi:hypothetical protein